MGWEGFDGEWVRKRAAWRWGKQDRTDFFLVSSFFFLVFCDFSLFGPFHDLNVVTCHLGHLWSPPRFQIFAGQRAAGGYYGGRSFIIHISDL
jgi:hypothetical protein